MVAWLVAVPISFAITAAPTYWLGLITKTDLLNIFVETGSSRYTRLIVFTAAWALLMTIIVSLLMAAFRGRPSQHAR